MLLYNQRKEFVGIDTDDLNSLGFAKLNELLSEANDFADLFVKKPGYIHNFKNFSWIDFILHSETGESKAIVHVLGRNYACTLHVTPFNFVSDDSGFAIIVKGLHLLRGAEDAQATKSLEDTGGIQATPVAPIPEVTPDITPNIIPETAPEPIASFEEETPSFDINLEDMLLDEPLGHEDMEQEPILPTFDEDLELNEPDLLDIPESQDIDLGLESPIEDNFNLSGENEFGAPVDLNMPLDIEDDLSLDETTAEETFEILEEEIKPEEAPMLGDYVSDPSHNEHLSELITSGTYQYNPQVAADELGLPVDLIEEFIGDFIDQAHEFHDDLFASVNSDDFDNVQILSHKLKGVAANLRVEDAFDTLSVVNTSKDTEEVLPNLNQFYKIIAKLEGKEIEEIPLAAPEVLAPIVEEIVPEEEPELSIGLKQPDDGPMLIDEDVQPMSDEDLYGDLLGADEVPEAETADFGELQETLEEDDLYTDLLATTEEIASFTEPESAIEEDDVYDNLLQESSQDENTEEAFELETPQEEFSLETPVEEEIITPEEEIIPALPEEEPAAKIEVPAINFDSVRAANELGIPVDIVNEFVQDFKEQVSSHMGDFDAAILAEDTQGVKKTATLLKGMSDNLRLTEISELLKDLQSNNDINNTQDKLAILQAYANQL